MKCISGDISKILSSIKLTLSSGLYSAWASGGHRGNYTDYDAATHSVNFSSVSDLMQLRGIELTAGESEYMTIATDGNSAMGSYQFTPINLNVTQDLVTDRGDSIINGCVTYTICPDSSYAKGHPSNTPTVVKKQPTDFWAYPNPTHDGVTVYSATYKQMAKIEVRDMLGRIIIRSAHDFSGSTKSFVDLTGFAAGAYAINVYGADGKTQTIKIIKQ